MPILRSWPLPPSLALVACVAIACATLAPAPARAADAHEEAVALARRGDHDAALAALEQLVRERPDDRRLVFDRIAVLGWAGRDAEALSRAAGVDLAEAPAYVLETLGRSARNLKRFALAESVYRRSLARYPQRDDSRIGLAFSLADQGRHDDAAALLDEALAAAPDEAAADRSRRALLLAARGTLAEYAGDWVGALSHHQRALDADPRLADAQLGVIRSSARLGAAHVATDLARRHEGLLKGDERAALEGDEVAHAIRWGGVQQRVESGDDRFEWLDRALARSEPAAARLADALRAGAGTAGLDEQARRLLADRIVALESRRRPADALALHDAMRAAGLEVPAHALAAVADARLSLRQPEAAAEDYRRVLVATPENFYAALGLFYALIESERFDEALAHAGQLAGQTPQWLRRGRANYAWVSAQTAPALAQLYGDRLDDATRRLEPLVLGYPYNAGVRAAVASLAHARGWPRRADDELQRTLAIEPDSAGLRAARVPVLLELHAWSDAHEQLRAAEALRPEDHRVRDARDWWNVHTLRELEVEAGWGRSSDTTPSGNRDWRVAARLYSQPLATHWRVFAQAASAHARFNAIPLRWHREGLGAEYRARDLRLHAAATAGSTDRIGLDAGLAWQLDDHRSLEATAASVSDDLPMQAWAVGVRASELGLTARYRVHESRSFELGAGRLDFSDGNERIGYHGQWFQRWVSEPHWRFETTTRLGASRNSLAGAAYFNPASDLSLTVEAAAEWVTWRRYERSFRQRLAATAGRYRQQGYGSGPIYGLAYEHLWEFDRRVYLRYGVARLLHPYDGQRSGRTSGNISLRWRF